MSCLLNYKRTIVITCLCCLLLSFLPATAFGSENVTESGVIGKIVGVESYEVSDAQIIPGNSFTLTLTLKNYSNSNSGYVLVNVDCPTGIIPEYGTVSQCIVKNIVANGTQIVEFNFIASSQLVAESLDFSVYTSTNGASNTVAVRIPVGTVDPFQILSRNVPESAAVGESIVSNISFKVIGTYSVDDVVLQVKSNGEVIGSSAIGTLTYGITKSQGVTFAFDEQGTYGLEYLLCYTNNNGDSVAMSIGESTITVGKGSGTTVVGTTTDTGNVQTKDNQNLMIIGVSFVLILVLLLVIVIILKRNNK